MWNFMGQSGPATALVDFTPEFAPLLIGLLGVGGLAAAMLVWGALTPYLAHKRRPLAKLPSRAADKPETA